MSEWVREDGRLVIVLQAGFGQACDKEGHLLALPCQIGRNFEITVFTDLCKGLYTESRHM
jgi:hypothetical protein